MPHAPRPATVTRSAVVRSAVTALAVTAVALATGCGGSPDVAEDPSPQSVATATQPTTASADEHDPTAAARAYVEAIAGWDASAMQDALGLTDEGSPAYAYMMFSLTRMEAYLDAGESFHGLARDMRETDNGYEACDSDDQCTVFGDFQHRDGLLTDLTVDGTAPGPRLTLGDGTTVESRGVTAEFLVAYRAITEDALLVTMRLATGEGTTADPHLYSATYRDPDGAQRTASYSARPTQLGADSHATALVIFDRVEPGGSVTFDGCVNDCADLFEITLDLG